MTDFKHFMYIPFTGLGLYGGFRGNAWLKKRIQIFKHFVVPSLQEQTNQNFSLWVSWRPEEKTNKQVKELRTYLEAIFPQRVVFTYAGVCFWDDKLPDDEARMKLMGNIHGSMNELINHIGDVKDVLMTIQPSDDCYDIHTVDSMQVVFKYSDYTAAGYTMGHIMNYQTGEVREYNPKTNPPFYTIRFPKAVFIDPFKHLKWTGPYKSHEYVPDHTKYQKLESRGFLVGCHGENISTHFNIPYAGDPVDMSVLTKYGLMLVPPLKLRYTLRKRFMLSLPHWLQRKIRYYIGEKISHRFYQLIHG